MSGAFVPMARPVLINTAARSLPAGSSANIAAHLLATRQHDVHLCCGRPFVSAAALAQHTRDSQTGVHEVAQFYVEPPTAAW